MFFVYQTSAYAMRIIDWSSDVCSSYLRLRQETAVNPDDLSSGHKGVDFGIVDQQHLNIAWVQASRLFKWRGDTVEQRLRFRIPQNLLRHDRPCQIGRAHV